MLKGIFKKKSWNQIPIKLYIHAKIFNLTSFLKMFRNWILHIFLLAGTQADSPIKFSQLSKANDLAAAGDIFELGLSQALGTSKKESAADFR